MGVEGGGDDRMYVMCKILVCIGWRLECVWCVLGEGKAW